MEEDDLASEISDEARDQLKAAFKDSVTVGGVKLDVWRSLMAFMDPAPLAALFRVAGDTPLPQRVNLAAHQLLCSDGTRCEELVRALHNMPLIVSRAEDFAREIIAITKYDSLAWRQLAQALGTRNAAQLGAQPQPERQPVRLFLAGVPGTGKTEALRRVFERLGLSEVAHFVDCTLEDDYHGVKTMLDELADDYKRDLGTLKVIVLDEVDALLEADNALALLRRLKGLLEGTTHDLVVACTSNHCTALIKDLHQPGDRTSAEFRTFEAGYAKATDEAKTLLRALFENDPLGMTRRLGADKPLLVPALSGDQLAQCVERELKGRGLFATREFCVKVVEQYRTLHGGEFTWTEAYDVVGRVVYARSLASETEQPADVRLHGEGYFALIFQADSEDDSEDSVFAMSLKQLVPGGGVVDFKSLAIHKQPSKAEATPVPTDEVTLRIAEYFCGIGTCSRAAERVAGDGVAVQVVLGCDIDPHCKTVFLATHGAVPFEGDITKIVLAYLCEILTAGFSCQPFSGSGLGLGWLDPVRGCMFFETLRMIYMNMPPIAVLENVKRLDSNNGGVTTEIAMCLAKWEAQVALARTFGISAENHVGVGVGGGEDGPLGAPDAEPYIGEWED